MVDDLSMFLNSLVFGCDITVVHIYCGPQWQLEVKFFKACLYVFK